MIECYEPRPSRGGGSPPESSEDPIAPPAVVLVGLTHVRFLPGRESHLSRAWTSSIVRERGPRVTVRELSRRLRKRRKPRRKEDVLLDYDEKVQELPAPVVLEWRVDPSTKELPPASVRRLAGLIQCWEPVGAALKSRWARDDLLRAYPDYRGAIVALLGSPKSIASFRRLFPAVVRQGGAPSKSWRVQHMVDEPVEGVLEEEEEAFPPARAAYQDAQDSDDEWNAEFNGDLDTKNEGVSPVSTPIGPSYFAGFFKQQLDQGFPRKTDLAARTLEKLQEYFGHAWKSMPDFELRDIVAMWGMAGATSTRELFLHLTNLSLSAALRPYAISVGRVLLLATNMLFKHSGLPGWMQEKMLVRQGGASEASRGMSLFKNSPISKQIAAVVSTVGAMMAFSDDEAVQLFLSKAGRILAITSTSVTGLDQVLRLSATLEASIESYQKTGDWRELFGVSNEERMFLEVEGLLAKFAALRDLKQNAAPEIGAMLKRAKELALSAVRTPLSSPVVVSKLAELGRVAKEAAAAFNVHRTAPVGFLFTGPPGCGKTFMCEMIHRCMLFRHGLPDHGCIMHTWQEGKHQHLPAVVSIVLLNDVATVKAEYTEAGNRLVPLIQQVVDTVPLYLEGASLEQKENGNLAPDLLLATTNASVYVDSTSSSGSAKLDRRLWIVECSWTDEAKQMQKEAKVGDQVPSLASLFANASRSDRKKMVLHRIGRMCNTDADGNSSNVLDFKVKTGVSLITNDPEQVVAFVMEAEGERRKGADRTIMLCPQHHAPYGSCCESEGVLRGDVIPQGNAPIRFSHTISTRHAVMAKAAAVLVGCACFLIIFRSLVDGFRYMFPPEPLPAPYVCPGCELCYQPDTQGGPCPRCSRVPGAPPKLVPNPLTQGTVSSLANVVKPEPAPYVPTYTSTSAAWLGAGSHTPVGKATWTGGESQYCIPVANNVFVFTRHFFTKGGGLSDPLRPLGDKFRIALDGRVREFLFDPNRMVAPGRADVAFYYIDHYPGLAHPLYRRLPLVPTMLERDVTLNGRAVSPLPAQPGYMEMTYDAPFTISGDCGLPLVGASGAIYGYTLVSTKRPRLELLSPFPRRVVMKLFL